MGARKDLSAGVAASFKTDNPVPTKAKSYINRGFVEKQKEYAAWLATQTLDTDGARPSPKKPQPLLDPIKVTRVQARWIFTVQTYVVGINKILRCSPKKRAAALKQFIADMNPPMFCLPNLVVASFLDGTYQIWNVKDPVLKSCETKLGFLRCTVCEKDFKWSSQERAIKHILTTEHYKSCKFKTDAEAQARSIEVMKEASTSALGK